MSAILTNNTTPTAIPIGPNNSRRVSIPDPKACTVIPNVQTGPRKNVYGPADKSSFQDMLNARRNKKTGDPATAEVQKDVDAFTKVANEDLLLVYTALLQKSAVDPQAVLAAKNFHKVFDHLDPAVQDLIAKDPRLLGMIGQETSYTPRPGLNWAQMNRATAQELHYDPDKLTDPNIGIKAMSAYLQQLQVKNKLSPAQAVGAYNTGAAGLYRHPYTAQKYETGVKKWTNWLLPEIQAWLKAKQAKVVTPPAAPATPATPVAPAVKPAVNPLEGPVATPPKPTDVIS